MAVLKVFTKNVIKDEYEAGLANSIHFCLIKDNGEEYELYGGYGILFPQGEIKDDNTIAARGALNPFIVPRNEGEYLICCDYVDEDGNLASKDSLYAWSTEDFVNFKALKLINRSEVEGGSNQTEITDKMLGRIIDKWDLECVREGKIHYPLIKGFADPVFFKWENKWYFLATNDLNGNIGLFLREAESIEKLFSEESRVSIILDLDEENHFIQTFWAPEWHIIGGTAYILFAVSSEKWGPQCHMMKYKGHGSIMDPLNWELPVRVCQKNGSYLTEEGITLDMTYFKDQEKSYVVWSERYNIGSALDSGSMLYIATIDEKNPTILTSDKVLLSRPLFGWENVAGTINNEGPYPLISGGKVYLSFSGGAAVGHTYAVGFLIADCGKNLLDTDNWTKYPTSLLNAYSQIGVDGPGHNSFFKDDEGNTMIAYHGQLEVRSSGMHKVQFDEEGFPLLNVGSLEE